jgi:hypothetical protein
MARSTTICACFGGNVSHPVKVRDGDDTAGWHDHMWQRLQLLSPSPRPSFRSKIVAPWCRDAAEVVTSERGSRMAVNSRRLRCLATTVAEELERP